MKQEGWSKAAAPWYLAKAQQFRAPSAHASSASLFQSFARTPQMTPRGPNPPPAPARTRGSRAAPTKSLALGLALGPQGATRPRTVTWSNQRPAPAVLVQLVLRPRDRLGGGAREGAGLPRGPMETRAGPQGWGQVCGAGPGSGGANERAPRSGPAGARDAAERLVATVTVCKRRGVVKGLGLGSCCWPCGYVRAALILERGTQELKSRGSGGEDGAANGPRLLGEAAC